MKIKKSITILFLLTIILTSITVRAETTPITPQPIDITGIFMQEEIKTRADFKAYADKKIADISEQFRTESQDFINKNFAVLDKRMRDLAQTWVIRITISCFTSVLLACLTYYFIRRKIEKKARPNIQNITNDGIKPSQAGIIEPEYMKKIKETNKLPNLPETNPNEQNNQFPIYNQQQNSIPVSAKQINKENKRKIKEIKKLDKIKREHEEYLAKQKKIYEKKRIDEEQTAREIAMYEQSKANVMNKITNLMGTANEIDKPINIPTPTPQATKSNSETFNNNTKKVDEEYDSNNKARTI